MLQNLVAPVDFHLDMVIGDIDFKRLGADHHPPPGHVQPATTVLLSISAIPECRPAASNPASQAFSWWLPRGRQKLQHIELLS
jgi:hypothetical protein